MIDAGKLNQYMLDEKNSQEMKDLVRDCASTLIKIDERADIAINDDAINQVFKYKIEFLTDLGLIKNKQLN